MSDVLFPNGEQVCPDCGGFIFRPGPRGGAAQNIECVKCLSRFNVARYPVTTDHQYEPGAYSVCRRCGVEKARHGIPGGGKIVMAHRIPSEAEGGGAWREDMFPRVLE